MCGCLDWVGKKVDGRALVGDDLLIEEIMSIIRRFVCCMAAIVVMSVWGVKAWGQETVDGLTYDSYVLTLDAGFTGSESDWKAVSAYKDNVVSLYVLSTCELEEIPDEQFSGWSLLNNVGIQSTTLKKIGKDAFYSCGDLTLVDLRGSGIEEIGQNAFMECSKLETVTFGENTKEIGQQAFASCGIGELTLKEGLETIGMSAFVMCYSLTTVHLPLSLKSIGDQAFGWCDAITKVEIAAGLVNGEKHEIMLGNTTDKTSSGSVVFSRDAEGYPEEFAAFKANATLYYDKETTYIGTDGTTENLRYYFDKTSALGGGTTESGGTESGGTTESGTGWEYDTEGKVLTLKAGFVYDSWDEIYSKYYNDQFKPEKIVVSEDFDGEIMADAFGEGWTTVTEVEVLSENVTAIPAYAFSRMTALKKVTLSKSVKTIGTLAFAQSGLEVVTLPEGVEDLGESAFSNCGSLKTVYLPVSLKTIGNYAFSSCGSITDVYIAEGLQDGKEHVIYLGGSTNKEDYGSEVFPVTDEFKASATLHYDESTTYVGGEGQNLSYYFSKAEKTGLEMMKMGEKVEGVYDMAGRRVEGALGRGMYVKVGEGSSRVVVVK